MYIYLATFYLTMICVITTLETYFSMFIILLSLSCSTVVYSVLNVDIYLLVSQSKMCVL